MMDSSQSACPICLLQFAFRARTQTANSTLNQPSQIDQSLPPDLVGLEILDLIGRGGMGAVYKARQLQLDRIVAVKVLPNEKAQDPEFCERFAREAKALAKLDHPNIVDVYDSTMSGDSLSIVMEYVDGMSLRDWLLTGPIEPSEALRLCHQICDGLNHAHENGTIHRDVKPENILIDRDGNVKIADFGLAKLTTSEACTYTLTATNVTMGTPRYMAPEQLTHASNVDARADVYALGVVLREMLVRHPTQGEAGGAQEMNLSPKLRRLLDRALAYSPEDRFSTVKEFQLELASATRPKTRRFTVLRWLTIVASVVIVLWYFYLNPQGNGRGIIPAHSQTAEVENRSTEKTSTGDEKAQKGFLIAPFDAIAAAKGQRQWSERLDAPLEFRNSCGMLFRLVPPGKFTIQPWVSQRGETIRATIDQPFYAGVTEVTVGQFRKFVEETGYETAAEKSPNGGWRVTGGLGQDGHRKDFTWKYPDFAPGDDFAVSMIHWKDAQQFCKWLGSKDGGAYRLPTEAEWLWLCRAGSEARYFFGDDIQQLSDYGWFVEDTKAARQPVGTKKPNHWGLFDVYGSNLELIYEWLSANRQRRLTVADSGEGPKGKEIMLLFGGCYIETQNWANNVGQVPSGSASHVGFRVILTTTATAKSSKKSN